MKYTIIHRDIRDVTSTYMQAIGDACKMTGAEVEIKQYKEKCDKNSIIVTDHLFSCIYYILKGHKRHISWFQGVIPEESYMHHKQKLRLFVLNTIEKICLKKCELVILVSEEMKRHYENKYHLDLSKKCYIMPCFNEKGTEKDSFYIKGKYTNNNFLYAGGIALWQCFDSIAKAYAMVEKKSSYKTHFYVYTKDQNDAKEIIEREGIKNFTIDFVPQDELSKRIKEYKYGFVLRDKCAVNNVATPTKLSNYLSNGIIPIYSSCLDSFNEVNKELNLGIIIDTDNIDEGVNNLIYHMSKEIDPDEVKKKCELGFSDYYNYDLHVKRMANILKK